MENDKQQLINNFNELLAIEVKARDYYDDLLRLDIPTHDKRAITEIRDDEKRHMTIAQSILDIIESDKSITKDMKIL